MLRVTASVSGRQGEALRGYLLTWLARQYRDADLRAFVREHPQDWLVWEAGPWRPPSRRRETLRTEEVRFAATAKEPIAIVLEPGPDGAPLRVGRAAGNDIVIDDPTLSRAHLELVRDGDARWRVADVGSSNGTRLAGARIGREPVPLPVGVALEAGAARLSLYDAAALFLRLRGAS
ncbi:FHA domain containing protein [Anaeromyxobacter dehalogenans 2CP-C]|uniref:FHA domain containing protein n=1 Tax=Anaeromyxobacter dehalogenans (strain 2CP-C) TaxID=290397 RepID=Q2IQ36_ANADE|nr:FHA domain containing protein [Anaeromyxobacter dehalogenans 2CP-C]